jgi:hypothetical protein
MTNSYFQGHNQANKWTDPEKNPRKRWTLPVPDQSSTATLSPGETIALPYELEAPDNREDVVIKRGRQRIQKPSSLGGLSQGGKCTIIPYSYTK